MNDPQRLDAAVGDRESDSAAGNLTADLGTRFYKWRKKRLLRLALRVAEEPILMLDVSQAPGFYWPVLMEHANRVVVAMSPIAAPLQSAQRALSNTWTRRIRAMPGPQDYTDLAAGSVDCILLGDIPPMTCNQANVSLLEKVRHATRDTAILFARVGHRLPTSKEKVCTCGTAPHPINPQSSNPRSLEKEFLRIGFNQIRHFSFAPGMDGLRVYVLRK